MWLIEYNKGHYINAEEIHWISMSGGGVKFSSHGDNENFWIVDKELESQFLNHLQAFNSGGADIEAAHFKMANKEAE